MKVFRPARLLLALLGACLVVLAAAGQGPARGAFAGKVTGLDGEPLEGATIVFRGLDIAVQRRIQTDAKGEFYYGGFYPGRYRLSILDDGQVLWAFPLTLPYFREVLRLDINLKKLHEAAQRLRRLDPKLEERQELEEERRRQQEKLEGHFNRGMRDLDNGRLDEAIAELRAARALEPGRAVIHALLAAALAEAGRLDEAIELYRHALDLQPDEAAHHNNLGTLLVRQGKLKEGLAEFEQAIRLDPDRAATYYFNRGAALLNAGRPRAAVPALEQAVKRDLTLAVAHYFLGLARLESSPGWPADAPQSAELRPGTIEAFRNYLRLEPHGTYAEQARTYLEQFGAPPPPPTPSAPLAETP